MCGYDADSGFTSDGVDFSWTALFEDLGGQFGNSEIESLKDFVLNHSEPQLTEPVGIPKRKIPLLPLCSRSHFPTLPISRCRSPSQLPPVAPDRPMKPVLEDSHFPPPEQPLWSILPQHGDLPLPWEMELKQTRTDIRYSHPLYLLVFHSALNHFFFLLSIKIYRKSPPSLMALPHSTLRNMKSMKNSCKSLSHLSMHYQLSIPHLSSILTISLHVWHIFWTSKQWSKIFSTF